MKLRPFFSYYGSKYRAARRYPVPETQIIIEPFAGGAGYATNYHDRKVRLYEIDTAIYSVWDYLIRASRQEINRLPIVQDLADLPAKLPQGARNLIGLWFGRCGQAPRQHLSSWGKTGKYPHAFWSEQTRDRIANQVDHIRHWKVHNKSYEEAPSNLHATWFIDPPYASKAGRTYRSGKPDFVSLSDWVLERYGQVIVCEHNGADWLPFRPLYSIASCKGKGKSEQRSEEKIYTSSNYRIGPPQIRA